MRTINTKQLVLRPLELHDEDMFCQLYTSQTTMTYMAPAYSHKKALSSFYSANNFNNNNTRIVKTWTIELNNVKASQQERTNKTIGIVMLYDEWYKKRLSPIEIGVMLLPEATGKAYGKEALAGLLSYCFDDLTLPQINIRFHPDNKAMLSVSKKLGFLPPDDTKPNNEINTSDIDSDRDRDVNNSDMNRSGSDETISNMEKKMWLHHLHSQQWQVQLALQEVEKHNVQATKKEVI